MTQADVAMTDPEQAARDLHLDAAEVDARRQERSERYETLTVPRLRLIGMQLVIVLVLLHNGLITHTIHWRSVGGFIVLTELYALLSWPVLLRFYKGAPRLLPLALLVVDVLVFGLAVYVTGANHSWLFPVVYMHVADQTATTFRRVIVLAHVAVAVYLGVLLAAMLHLHAPIDWGVEGTKLALLWFMGVYTASTARTAERLRARLVQTVRLSRELVGDLERSSVETQRALAASGVANRSKSEFLANMSHELRTPLNSVIGFADVLLRNRKSHFDDSEIGYLKRIRENGAHLLTIISDILDLSRIEAGRMDLDVADVNVEQLIQEVVASFLSTGRSAGVDLRVEAPIVLASVRTDRTRLRQILTNLIGNALKFTPEGSVTVRVNARGAQVRSIEVIDTGIGIPQDRLAVVFKPFEQADNTTRRKYGGTGLGLSISRSLSELLGYKLEAQSEPGRGSTFRLVLRDGAE
jgi:signal transduction histidine kinase